MGQVVLSKCLVTTEDDWIPVVLDNELDKLATEMGMLQEKQSKERNLNDRAINKDPEASLRYAIFSKRSEYAIHQWAGKKARVTKPGEFHNYPDVGQVNVRWIGDPTDGLMIQDRDQGELPMVLTTSKNLSFKDKTIWLIGWGMTDLLRRHYFMINQFREIKNWGAMGNNFQPHEQFIYPRSMLNPMKTLSKDFVNQEYKNIEP
jgi:hypothetical protein